MAPTRKMKTYGRSNTSLVNNSVDAFNLLFAKNRALLRKKNKKPNKCIIKELTARVISETALANDSFEISFEDQFDKLVKQPRKPPKNPSISNYTNKPELVNMSRSGSLSSKNYDYELHSSIRTRSQCKETLVSSLSHGKMESTDSFNQTHLRRLKEPSQEKIVDSLEIEKETNKNLITSLSYIKIPHHSEYAKVDPSCDNSKFMLSVDFNNFHQKLISSTPVAPFKRPVLGNQTISPVKMNSLLVDNGGLQRSNRFLNIIDETKDNSVNSINFQLANQNGSNIPDNDDHFINLRRGKILKSNSIRKRKNLTRNLSRSANSYGIQKSVTASLESFSSFEELYLSKNYFKYSKNNIESFEEMLRSSSSVNFITKRKAVKKDKSSRNTRNSFKLKKDLIKNNLHKELVVNIERMPIDLVKTSFVSLESSFENFYSKNISKELQDMRENNGKSGKSLQYFEEFYATNYSQNSKLNDTGERNLLINVKRCSIDNFESFYASTFSIFCSQSKDDANNDNFSEIGDKAGISNMNPSSDNINNDSNIGKVENKSSIQTRSKKMNATNEDKSSNDNIDNRDLQTDKELIEDCNLEKNIVEEVKLTPLQVNLTRRSLRVFAEKNNDSNICDVEDKNIIQTPSAKISESCNNSLNDEGSQSDKNLIITINNLINDDNLEEINIAPLQVNLTRSLRASPEYVDKEKTSDLSHSIKNSKRKKSFKQSKTKQSLTISDNTDNSEIVSDLSEYLQNTDLEVIVNKSLRMSYKMDDSDETVESSGYFDNKVKKSKKKLQAQSLKAGKRKKQLKVADKIMTVSDDKGKQINVRRNPARAAQKIVIDDITTDFSDNAEVSLWVDSSKKTVPKRGRGRPRKIHKNYSNCATSDQSDNFGNTNLQAKENPKKIIIDLSNSDSMEMEHVQTSKNIEKHNETKDLNVNRRKKIFKKTPKRCSSLNRSSYFPFEHKTADFQVLAINLTKNDFRDFNTSNISKVENNFSVSRRSSDNEKETELTIEETNKILGDTSQTETFEMFYKENYGIYNCPLPTVAVNISEQREIRSSVSLNVIESSYVENTVTLQKISTISQRNLLQSDGKTKNLENCLNEVPQDLTKELAMVSPPGGEKYMNNCLNAVSQDLTKEFEKSLNSSGTSDIIESSVLSCDNDNFKIPKSPVRNIQLKSGKSWKRSLSLLRQSTFQGFPAEDKCSPYLGQKCPTGKLSRLSSCQNSRNRRLTVRLVPLEPISILQSGTEHSGLVELALNSSYVPDQLIQDSLEDSFKCLSLNGRNTINNKSRLDQTPVTAREIVLRKCGQQEPLEFSKCFPDSVLQHCHKIGEGVYGEVFLFRNPKGGTSVIKIVPVEGDLIVNGEKQKKFEEVLSEIIITMELSNLRNNKQNGINAFTEVQKIQCVQGRYPEKLIFLWDEFEETRGTENDCPEVFGADQLYIVFQMAYGGRDLEAFDFNNAMQAYSMFQQVAIGLAAAEEELRFEHRDLHWGNVLVSSVDSRKITSFNLDNRVYEIPTMGVEVAIIDFTLSRIEHDGVVIFNDLSLDPDLFQSDGDYQFEVYRLMQQKNRDNWKDFQPYSNVLWLHYILDKAITALRYKNTKTKRHKDYLQKLKCLKEDVLCYRDAKEFVVEKLLQI